MAKKLIIAFDVVDEDTNSIIGKRLNAFETPLAIDAISSMDITYMNMAIYSFLSGLQGSSVLCHLFPQTPYGVSMEPNSSVNDKSDRIYFEVNQGYIRLVHPQEDNLNEGV